MPIRHRSTKKAAAGRRLIADTKRKTDERTAVVLQRVQGQVEDRASHERPFHGIGRRAGMEKLLDVVRQRIEEPRPRRLRQVEGKADRLFSPRESGGEAKIG